jgi:nitronate monooxygenase
MTNPMIIQGGMGAGVSNWMLAKTVSQTGQMGVTSGTAQGEILARTLQKGDPGGHYRRAIENFPIPESAQNILDKFFIPNGKPLAKPFIHLPKFTHKPEKFLQELTVVANFAEIFLAKEGHSGPVGINLLEKVLLPNLYSLYGAMMAGVDYVIMGAGIPREIPGVLDRLKTHKPVCLKIPVEGATAEDDYKIRFDPKSLFPVHLPDLKRPDFIGIISSATLALVLAKKASGKVNGFIIEGHTAGGHNAPPRGKLVLSEKREPIYGNRDIVDYNKIRKIGLPFWLAGSYGSPEKLQEALDVGAQGIQVGTAFAFCRESGFSSEIKEKVIPKVKSGAAKVFTDPKASPTGYPFKVVSIEGTVSENKEYLERPRICDMGYLRHLYKKPDGSLGYRCPSEPVELFVKKGGDPEETKDRKCLCNGLLANLDLAQQQKNNYTEKVFVTAGDDIKSISRILKNGSFSYSATDVINYLLNGLPSNSFRSM